MSLSCTCLIPFYNEGERILSVIERLALLPFLEKIIVVDDGSTDGGKQRVENFLTQHTFSVPIELVSYTHNKGKSFAVGVGLQQVQTPYVLLFDADLSHIHIDEIRSMLTSINDDPRIDMGILRRIYSSWYIKLFYKELILSGQRILKTQDLKNVFCKSFDKYQLEVAINAYMKKHKKIIVWYPFSAENVLKHRKRGYLVGYKKDMYMFLDIFAYTGFFGFLRHVLRFKAYSQLSYQKKFVLKK